MPHQRDETCRTCLDATCRDVKRSEVMRRAVASCDVASCYVVQADAIQCRATHRSGPSLACQVCCRVAFPSVFFFLVSQPAQSYSSGRDQGSQHRKRTKVQTVMPPAGACSSKNCRGWLPLILLSPILLRRRRAPVKTPAGLQSSGAAERREASRLPLTRCRLPRGVICVLWYACYGTRAVIRVP